MLCGFPLACLAALYGVYRERSWQSALLLGLVVSLVCGHMGMTVTSDSLIGERFYFEGYFAIAILAARGWDQLRRHWQISRAAQRSAILATAALAVYYYWNLSDITITYPEAYGEYIRLPKSWSLDRGL